MKWYQKAAKQEHVQAKKELLRISDEIRHEKYQKEQSEKANVCIVSCIVEAVVGFVLLANAPEDSWLNEKLILDWTNGLVTWVISIYVTDYIAKQITGYDG